MDLIGKTVLVTGGGRGVGKGIATILARYGMNVVINYNSNSQEAQDTYDTIRKSNGNALLVKADVSNIDEVGLMFEIIKKHYGQLDVLINNAALQKNLWIMEYSDDDFDRIIGVNLKGYLLCMQKALPLMRKNGGRIINISSIHAKRPTNFDPVYSMTKGGIKMLTREAAIEFASYGITVNTIELGAIEIGVKSGNPLPIRSKPNKFPFRKYLTGRYGEPEEVGELVAYIASGKSSFLNGASIRFDGGRALM